MAASVPGMNHNPLDHTLMIVLSVLHGHGMPGMQGVIINGRTVIVHPGNVATMREFFLMAALTSNHQTAAAKRDEAAVEMVTECDSR